ncbi:MAG: hypothetical protein NZZ41_02545 [Candidatus Dojkabacteria bacterium]|nr:hypothetical protein [Candidatus Dojkabacteria bacterium]
MRFLIELLSTDLSEYDETTLNSYKEAVLNMETNYIDEKFKEKFTDTRYRVLNKIESELAARKKKSVIHLPASGQMEMFSFLENEMLTKAVQIERKVGVEAEHIVNVCSGDVALMMDFIRRVDEYLNSGSDFDLNELIQWMQRQSIPVVATNRSFKSTFVKDFYILIAEFLEEHYNVSPQESDNQAKLILEEAFDKERFERDLLEVYKNTTDKQGGDRAIEVARLLVRYNIFDDSLIDYIKNNL